MSSHDHSLHGTFTCLPGVTREQIMTALEPIVVERGWHIEGKGDDVDVTTEYVDEFKFVQEDGQPLSFYLYTCGDVSEDYLDDTIADAAENLSALVQPGAFELRDFDTADLDNAVTAIWVGADEALDQVRKNQGRMEALDALRENGFSEAQIAAVAQFISDLPEDEPAPISNRPRG